MRVFSITDNLAILRATKDAEPKYRQTVSAFVIEKFGRGPYPPAIQKEVFTFFQDFFIAEFEKACEKETFFSFYREVFTLHEQATNLRRLPQYHQLPQGLNQEYISIYRRVLKMVLEKGCDVEMIRGEMRDVAFIDRIKPILNNLLYLGEMIFDFGEAYAEYCMIDGISQIVFDENGLYQRVRESYYDHVFAGIARDMEREADGYVIDPTGAEDFRNAIRQGFGFDYKNIGLLIGALYEKFELEPPDCLSADKHNFMKDAANFCQAPQDVIEAFFAGFILDQHNKMTLTKLVRKPYSMNRFLYRPFLEWRINGMAYLVCGIYSMDEAENSLILNAIPWKKIPAQWGNASGVKAYVHRKHEEHDKWLDDKVEAIIKGCGLKYHRSVKTILTKQQAHPLLIKSLGEIDFLIICPSTKKLLVTECKHLLRRYDMVNWKLDYDIFTVDGKNMCYNNRLASKVAWIKEHLSQVEEHFRILYKDDTISLDTYDVEGVFVINTPTFYMHNALYRIYTYRQFENVITGLHTDPVYRLVVETDDAVAEYWVRYPYFAKRHIAYFEADDDGKVDKYGFPIEKK